MQPLMLLQFLVDQPFYGRFLQQTYCQKELLLVKPYVFQHVHNILIKNRELSRTSTLQTHHAYSTLKRRGIAPFHIISTCNTLCVFVGYHLNCFLQNIDQNQNHSTLATRQLVFEYFIYLVYIFQLHHTVTAVQSLCVPIATTKVDNSFENHLLNFF